MYTICAYLAEWRTTQTFVTPQKAFILCRFDVTNIRFMTIGKKEVCE